MPPPFKFRKREPYIPAPNSGAHCILVGMLKAEQNELIKTLTKQQVLDFATKYSTTNMRDNAKIWASIKGLVDKGYIDRIVSRNPSYYLLDSGRELALKLVAFEENLDTDSMDIVGIDEDSAQDTRQSDNLVLSQQATYSNFEPFTLESDTYDVVLIVDQRERIETQQFDGRVKFEIRTLACGDFLWIARPKTISKNDRTKDLVLDYIVERKRLDDLAQSITDGRLQQQKQRLKQSGVRRLCYLIEDTGKLREGKITSSGLNQASTDIEIVDGISVERVKTQKQSIDYLVSMTGCIERFLSAKRMTLRAASQDCLANGRPDVDEFMTFSEFQTAGAKITNWTVKEMFAKHLIQITGMADKKVAAIVEKYPTLSHLVDAYDSCRGEKEKENLLSKLDIAHSNRTLGPVLSKRVYTSYSLQP